VPASMEMFRKTLIHNNFKIYILIKQLCLVKEVSMARIEGLLEADIIANYIAQKFKYSYKIKI
jgi:hypothetical protein